MYYSRLSELSDILSKEQIEKLDRFFSNLIGGARENITISKVVNELSCSIRQASLALKKCCEIGLLTVSYGIRCPECGTFIKRTSSLGDVIDTIKNCYACEMEIEVGPEDIELLYSIDDSQVFEVGQQELKKEETSAGTVAQEDTLKNLLMADGINEFFFNPSEQEYTQLETELKAVNNRGGTTKTVGDALENFTSHLFGHCSIFKTGNIRTSTNQIDCYIRNKKYIPYGVFRQMGSRFVIECKNESNTPSGAYMSKLHSIISTINAKEKIVKFGIIVSKEPGPSTFRSLANKYYLMNGIVIIAICYEEISILLKNRGNLLEMIERKIDEIIFDATSDLVKAGLYE